MDHNQGDWPHQIGLMVMRQIHTRLRDSLDSAEKRFLWLDEILQECKNTFVRSNRELLPQTPGIKRGRKRLKKKLESDEDVNDQENIPISIPNNYDEDADVEEMESDSPPRKTRKTRATRQETKKKVTIPNHGRTTRNNKPVSEKVSTFSDIVTFNSPAHAPSQTLEVPVLQTVLSTPKNNICRVPSFKTPADFDKMNVKEKAHVYEEQMGSCSSMDTQTPLKLSQKSNTSMTETPTIDCTPDTPETVRSHISTKIITLSPVSSNSSRTCSSVTMHSGTPKRKVSECRKSVQKCLKLCPSQALRASIHKAKTSTAQEKSQKAVKEPTEKKTRTKLRLKKKDDDCSSVTSSQTSEVEDRSTASSIKSDSVSKLSEKRSRANSNVSGYDSRGSVDRTSSQSKKSRTSSISSTHSSSSSSVRSTRLSKTRQFNSASELCSKRIGSSQKDSGISSLRTSSVSLEKLNSVGDSPSISKTGRRTRSQVGIQQTNSQKATSDVFAVPHGTPLKSKKRLLTETDDEMEVEVSRPKRSCTGRLSDKENRSRFQYSKGSGDESNSTMDEDSHSSSESDSSRSFMNSTASKDTQSLFTSLMKNKMQQPGSKNISLGVRSFIKKTVSPKRLTLKEKQELKIQELKEKEKKEQERLLKCDEMKKQKLEEQKKKREERARKVQEFREKKEKKEMDIKNKLAKKLDERYPLTSNVDKLKDSKIKEDKEKIKLRVQKVEEKRKQDEEERLRKLHEQEMEERRREEIRQKQKELEEHERQIRIAEEKRRQDERLAQIEREREAERCRLQKIEEEKERERLRVKEEKEKQLAKEKAEREKAELNSKKERDLKIQQQLDRLNEMEKKRLAEQTALHEKWKKEEEHIKNVMKDNTFGAKPNMAALAASFSSNTSNTSANMSANTSSNTSALAPPMNTTVTFNSSTSKHNNSESYEMTPPVKKKKIFTTDDNYNIDDICSDDSTDDESRPRKKIPQWAVGTNLKIALINQHYHPPPLDEMFEPIVTPDLNELFAKKRARFNKRTSSACWDSPLMKV